MNKGDIMSHWVSHSELKEFYTNNFFKRKKTIEDIEVEQTET